MPFLSEADSGSQSVKGEGQDEKEWCQKDQEETLGEQVLFMPSLIIR